MNGDCLLSLLILGGSITLITYAWIHYRHTPSPMRVRKEGGTFLLGEGFMSIAYHLVTPLINRLVVTIVWSGVVATVSLFLIDKFVGLRVEEVEEQLGLDQTQHSETAYNLD